MPSSRQNSNSNPNLWWMDNNEQNGNAQVDSDDESSLYVEDVVETTEDDNSSMAPAVPPPRSWSSRPEDKKKSKSNSRESSANSGGSNRRAKTASVSSSSSSLKEKLQQTTQKVSQKAAETWSALRKPGINGETAASSTSQRESSASSQSSSQRSSSRSSSSFHRYTVQELVHSLNSGSLDDLPPALERRVRDFHFAQEKRRERSNGQHRAWGIFGLYAHLSDIRADLEWAEDAAWRRQRKEPYLSWSDFEKGRDKGLHNRPWFTYSVLAICSIMLFVTFGVNGWKVEPLNVNPLIGPSAGTLIKVGARKSDLIVNEGQYFRLFTPLVLHAGLIHFIINMLALYFIGGAVEQSHGWLSACVLFVLPAVGGNILSAICLPQYISVGASGGIFGLIGGCLADIAINWNLLFLKSTTEEEDRWRHGMVLFWLAFDIIVNCLMGLTPFVDNFTHLGGLVYGLLCGLSTIEKLAVGFFGLQSNQKSWRIYVTRFLGLITSVVAIMVTTVVLVQSDGVTSPCHGCRYLSCIPFPPNAEERWWECDDCDFVIADLFVSNTDMYEEIALECPDGQVETIDVSSRQWYDKHDVRKALPSYCREYCENVFSTKG